MRALQLTLIASLVVAGAAVGQVPADQQAEMILTSARKAFNEQNFPVAVQRFSEFLQKFGGHPQANNARYQLGLSYLDSPERNFDKALEQLNPIAGNAGLPESPLANYHAGFGYRGLGLRELDQLAAKPNEADQIRQRANQRFAEAANRFDTAAKAFRAKLPKEAEKATPEIDWAVRSLCDRAEMELRQGKFKEARVSIEPATTDPVLLKSTFAKLALYHHGHAAFQGADYLVAGRSLALLAPFDDAQFGLHARYLMGRIYQITDQKAEAAQTFEAVQAQYEQSKKDAAEALKKPETFKNNPFEKARLEGLVRNPPPDHVSATVYYSAGLAYEAGKFGDSLAKFQQFAKDFPKSPLLAECQLRIGFCQVQLKAFPEAMAVLLPLVDKQPKIADQIQYWIGKAQVGIAQGMVDPAKAGERDAALKTAIATLRNAAERANGLNQQGDTTANLRRAEMLLELADTLQLAKQFRDAAQVYEAIVNEKHLAGRNEEIIQRRIAALHLAGDFPQSDAVANQFLQQYAESPLRVAVLFRLAENAYFQTLAFEKKNERTNDLSKLYDDAAKRYQTVIDQGAEFDRLPHARFGLAMCYFKKGDFEKAREAIEKIPVGDRTNDLSYAPYLLAECLLRQAPATVSGAGETRKLLETLEVAAGNLDGFVTANPKAPEVPDAMLKLGVCQLRQAALIAVPAERAPILNNARATFEKLLQQFPKETAAAQGVMERAKVISLQGDKNGAINELRRFAGDPLQASPAAPVALIALATLLREQNKAEEASQVLNTARQKHEPGLQKQPEQIALLRYHHGVALQEAGKFGDARQVLDSVQQLAANTPVGIEASLRGGQCRIAEARKAIEAARMQLASAGGKPDQVNAANQVLQNAFNAMNDAGLTLERRGEEYRQSLPANDARERMYYESAWAFRAVAEHEVNATRVRLQQEKQRKLQEEADRKAPPGTKAAAVSLPEIRRAEVPVQPAEQRARTAYESHIKNFNDSLLSIDSRFELAELYAERNEYDPAIKHLKEANDLEPKGDKLPTPELIDKIRIRLGTCLFAKNEFDPALGYFEAVANNPKSPLVAHGLYRSAEAFLAKGDAAKAVERLVNFRDKGEFHNIPGVSDRAMLRLGHAYAALKQWEPSRQAYETCINRYGNSPWINDARYGFAFALQNANQFDPAVNAYQQVINFSTTELAAKAHLQIGQCRMAQKRYGDAAASFLIIPYTFDYPDLSAAALLEAARALTDDQKPDQAEKLLRKVLKDYPDTEWAKAAKERIDKTKP
jgi:cellulose synthase operon protein C